VGHILFAVAFLLLVFVFNFLTGLALGLKGPPSGGSWLRHGLSRMRINDLKKKKKNTDHGLHPAGTDYAIFGYPRTS
jgi:hypothetical protein